MFTNLKIFLTTKLNYMIPKEVKLSSEFKKEAIKAIFSIILFVITYLLIFFFALILTGLCIAGGISLIAFKPMFITIALGIGLSSLGILILIFLIKFIFTSHKIDKSHLLEINKEQEPKLFELIDEIVKKVDTSFPKKVYLSHDVNASVFYDSSFWSMFFPIKKNLQIGLGLVNSVTKEELKAILSHEFGHFSQRSMKIGSYVYNVNQIIFNMLYENDSYQKLVQEWGNVSNYFSIFINIAIEINKGIQWILKQMYDVVNKNYMGLSREMEFHADEIAASITGFEPLKNSLLRLHLADNSFNEVLNFYSNRQSENIISENLYNDHINTLILNFNKNYEGNNIELPSITLEELSKYDKSKLVIKDQWASHPSIKDRIYRLEASNLHANQTTDSLANEQFINIIKYQKEFTNKILNISISNDKKNLLESTQFLSLYKQEISKNTFPEIFNGYYDAKNPIEFEIDQEYSNSIKGSFEELFSDEKIDWIYTSIALQNDIESLKNISNRIIKIKTFDYDGIRYNFKQAPKLIDTLNLELNTLQNKIAENDKHIFSLYFNIEKNQNISSKLKNLYHELFNFDKSFESKTNLYFNIMNDLQFISIETPYDQIIANFKNIYNIENQIKQEINLLLSDNLIKEDIQKDIMENLKYYTSNELTYFNGRNYIEAGLNSLYSALHNYIFVLNRKYFLMKKELLDYQYYLYNSFTPAEK